MALLKQDIALLFGIMSESKALALTAEYEQDIDGRYCAWVNEIPSHAEGNTYEECRMSLVRTLREFAVFYCEDIEDWYSHNPGFLPFVLKVIFSSEEELKSCLAGKN